MLILWSSKALMNTRSMGHGTWKVGTIWPIDLVSELNLGLTLIVELEFESEWN